MVRCGAILLGSLLLSLCVIVLCLAFYGYFFRYTSFFTLLAPALVTLLPAMIFCLGMGWGLGKIHPAMVYLLMAVVFLLAWLPLPQALDFSLSSFFTEYPLALGTLDPAFTLPGPILFGRALYAAAGVLLFVWSQCGRKDMILRKGFNKAL